MKKVYNFNAGPCVLPKQAIDAAIAALQDFKGTGMPVISVSHRSKEWEAVMDECRALWKELLNIPDNYEVLFLGECISPVLVAMNLLGTKQVISIQDHGRKKLSKRPRASAMPFASPLLLKRPIATFPRDMRSPQTSIISISPPITPSMEQRSGMIWTAP